MATVINRSRCSVKRIIMYYTNYSNICNAAVRIRCFSNFENNDESQFTAALKEETTTVWPDESIGPFGSSNKKFPLPGNIGTVRFPNQQSSSINTYIPPNDALESGSNSERQLSIISHFIAESDFLDEDYDPSVEDCNVTDTIIQQFFEGATVELAVQDCPKILQKDFHSIFLGIPKEAITVITIAQKTTNDMSGWNTLVEEEREKLVENFITTATEICQLLKAHQIWCDFIEPTSGQAYFGPYTNSTLFETDDRYTHLGFRIEDLGCCKVIAHKKWGSRVFVGSVVTTASKDHPVVKRLLKHAAKQ